MIRAHAVVYDIEIEKCVPDGDIRNPGYEYCKGWGDKAGMGVSVVAAIDLWTGRPHVFLKDNLEDFQQLVASRTNLIGFNSAYFDDLVLAAAGFPVVTTWDMKAEFGGLLKGGTRVKGRSLADFVRVNLPGQQGKSMDGADAPKAWQREEFGRVIDYCLGDVYLTAELLSKLPNIIDPVTGQTVQVYAPFLADHVANQLTLLDNVA